MGRTGSGQRYSLLSRCARAWAVAATLTCLASAAAAEEGVPLQGEEGVPLQGEEGVPLQWMAGPGTAPIGEDLAEIELSDEYAFLDGDGTRRFMELNQNPVSGREVGTVAPLRDDASWFLVFEFDPIGYVEDDEKDALDADAILDSIREGTEIANEERRRRGWTPMSIVGWYEEPRYDESTNDLTWAVLGETAGHRSVNRITKLLGRRGAMTATLVVGSPEEMDSAVLEADALMAGYRYRPGNTYAEYVPGSDKLATYGLTALVVGGGAAALAKSGLLAKLWKPLLVGLVAIGAGVKRFFFSGRSARHDPEKPIV